MKSKKFAIPTNDFKRSKFNMTGSVKTTFNSGRLIPIDLIEILPGDHFKLDLNAVVRKSVPLRPTMDLAYLDIFAFFVPNRIVWQHWAEFFGENKEGPYLANKTEFFVPSVLSPDSGWSYESLAAYYGNPIGIPNTNKTHYINALPFKGYAKIVDEWFRDQNLQQPVLITTTETGSTPRQGTNGGDYINDLELGGLPFIVGKFHDYFTSCLLSPQKGTGLALPIVDGSLEWLPVYSRSAAVPNFSQNTPMMFSKLDGSPFSGTQNAVFRMEPVAPSVSYLQAHSATTADSSSPIAPQNLWANFGSELTPVMINDLRLAFQLQRLLERDARGGTRYAEIVHSQYGVQSNDARLQRPEFLGGYQMPIADFQVNQTSSTDGTSPQGNEAAYSYNSFSKYIFEKAFTEHGFVHILACVRVEQSYQQGVPRHFSRGIVGPSSVDNRVYGMGRYDYYFPALAEIGEQPVLNQELYLTDNVAVNHQFFGYQEAYADYRYRPNRITGQMNSAAPGAIDEWHYGNFFSSLPTLTSAFIQEDMSTLDNSLAVDSSIMHQFKGDFYLKWLCTRNMPFYSVPGRIDHN